MLVLLPESVYPGVVVKAGSWRCTRCPTRPAATTSCSPCRPVTRWDHIQDVGDVSEFELNAISHFFEHYKDLEPGKEVNPGGWVGREEAEKVAVEAVERLKSEEH